MSLFKMKRGQESKVSSLAKEDGSLIFSLNGANDSTVRLDQSVNGTVQRLGIAVDKAKNSNAVIDYNDPNRRIQIGYANAGLTTSNLTHVAGYTNDGRQIKDVSKDVLKSWLGVSDSDLGSYQKRYRNANAITTGGTDLNGTLPPAIFAYKNGYPLHTDPEFANSNNGINIYNNSGNGNVTIERIAMENGNSSGYVLKVSNKGSASPGLGGWYFGDTSVHARQYTCIFRAKIPAGRNVQWASNSIGTNGTSFWLTDRAGTGKWEWYAYHVDCGSANFSSTNFFYIDGAVGTVSAPVVWYLSYANTIINSWGNYDGLRTRYSDLAINSNALGGSSLKNITDAINNSTASATSKYLPLTGGNMTGNIGYAGSKATYSMIKFIDNKADTYGNGIAIGGGGLTIIGGGESAATIAAQHSSGGDENMVVANDESIDFYTNCQNGFASAKHITMNTDGSVTASTFNGFATNSDKLDGYHENSFLRYRNATSTAGKNTLWNQIGIQEYDNCYPDGLTNGIYGYGEVISLPSRSARFDLWVNHNSSNQISNGLQYRSGWDNDKKSWRMILDSVNYTNYAAAKNSYNSASISDATIKLGRSDGSTGTTLVVNNVANSSSAIFSTYSAYPQGFQSRTTSATWGNTTGTFITGWHTSSGGDVAFMNDNPSNGKVSMKLDGYFYQNEGSKRVLDTDDAANYVKKSGDTMTGTLTLKTGNQKGIKLGSAWLTAASDVNGEFVLQGGHLRFGSSDWDYNQWAGLKYDAGKKSIYLGLADNAIFTANSAQSGGSIFTPGVNNIYVGASTATKVLTSANIGDYASGKTAFTELDTTTNNVIKLTRANGATIQKTINNVANASTAEYAKNAGKLGGVEASKYAKKEDIPAIPSNLDVANRLQSYAGAGNTANSLFYRYGVLGSSWSNFPVSSLPSTGIGANFQGKNTGVLHIAAGSSYHDLAFTAGAKDNQGILYAGTGRNPAYILDTENYKTKGNVFNSLTANTSFTAKVNVTIDGGSY